MNVLDKYQEDFIADIAKELRTVKSVCAQSPTGSGKTVIFAAIAYRFICKTNKDVFICVHRDELLNQTRAKLIEWYGIISQKIDAKTTSINPKARVFVAMVETFDRRSTSNSFLDNFNNVGLTIFDEAHIGNFKKIFVHFGPAKRIGFTATPVSSNKKDPLKNYYQSIVIGPTIKSLIQLNKINPRRGVVPCVTYSLKNVNREDLKTKGDEFDENDMGNKFSNPRQIQNTIDAYLRLSYAKKTLCFNANIEHSLRMNEAFLREGLNSRHLDGNKNGKYGNDSYRKDCMRWLSETPNAILNNVGVATTGLDEPSIESVIVNKSTKSLPLWNQMNGRGARAYQYPNGEFKTHFLSLDMGDNVIGGNFGEWSDEIDWKILFENPKIPRDGVAPVKSCPKCGAINHATVRVCTALEYDWITESESECGYLFPIKTPEEDNVFKEMIRIGSKIDIDKTIEYFSDRSEYYSMYQIYIQLANIYKKEIDKIYLDAEILEGIIEAAYQEISKWFKKKGKRRFPNLREDCKVNIVKALQNVGFAIYSQELEEINNK